VVGTGGYVMAARNDLRLHESGLSMLVPPAADDLGEAVHVACRNHLFCNRLQPLKNALEASICRSRTAKEKFNWCSVVPTIFPNEPFGEHVEGLSSWRVRQVDSRGD
jgi:hypothetical protein